VEFRILGPLDLIVDGRVRSLPAGGERAVLELLLLNAGRVVPASTLVDALWGDDLPGNATNALQGRISRLRKVLADAGLPQALVTTRRPGYVADIDPERVDAHRFIRLVQQARRRADQNAPVEAISLYDEGLALWRGDPLAEFAGEDWARAEINRLTALRMAATEERNTLRLLLGQHAELVAELEDLTARYPVQERLHGQLMLALYRSGRQADALAAYQRLRQTLDAELGLDPSAELRTLEQAILRQDAKLNPPARVRPTAQHNLPARLTSFVGRGRELDEVGDLLGGNRLVTLTGPGGAGKTSVAVEAAARVTDRYGDGVWLIRLAGVTDPAHLPQAFADTLGVPDGSGTVEDRLVRFLGERTCLLLVDNCEHLIDAAAVLVERLLVSCDRLRVLATSREPLAVPGEVQLAIPPLDIPPPDAVPQEMPAYDAVRLFADRAGAALPAFRLDAATAGPVAEVCRRLDGIPLALELAAARVKTLAVGELAARLDDRFRLLTAGPRTAEARQRTLRATVEWSHQLLPEPEQVLFRRLSVFRGGWSADAAERVCAGGGIDRGEIVGLLAGLVDRSLVVADHREAVRFRMLETLRHYAAERLAQAGEDQGVGRAHATYYTEVAERGEPLLRGPEQGRWLRWLATERDNLRAALAWCRGHAAAEPELGLRLVAALGWFWYFASHQDGRHEVTAMLAAATGGSPAARAGALLGHAVVARPRSCIVHPSAECAPSARDSWEIFTTLGKHHRAAMSRTLMAVEGIGRPDRATPLGMLAEANDQFVAAGDQWGQALVLFVEMELHGVAGRLDEAAELAHRALAVFRRLGDHWGTSAIQYHLGLALHRAGRLDGARQTYEAALVEGRQVGMANTIQYLLANMGHIALLRGDPDRAERLFAEAAVAARELGAEGSPLAALGEGLLARYRDDLTAAQRHFSAALGMLAAPEVRDWAAAATSGLGFLAESAGDLAAAERQHQQALQLATDAGHVGAAARAVAMEGLACVAAARGDAPTAATLLGTAARWRADARRPATPLEQHDIDRAADRARALLDPDAYAAAEQAVLTPPQERGAGQHAARTGLGGAGQHSTGPADAADAAVRDR
jgi:predicted ATPase/DNA-binding SARP family transcriptional activator/tetratricopeptide (TPR) repeat protein